jgi:multidrug/hemolysin transport system permease protein
MHMVWKLTQRNINIYIRNRASVFFSFLSVIIIIGLYALFLGDMQVKNINATLREYGQAANGARFLVDSWIISGLLAINAVTITLGVLGTMVFDIEYKRFPDFLVAPVSRTGVVLSYLLSAWIIGFVFSMIALVIGELYILSGGGQLLSPVKLLETTGVLVLSVISSSSIMYFLASFLRSGSAFGTLSTLLGTLIGFFAGAYIPIGVMPQAVQKFIILVPFSHSAAVLRQIFCEQPLVTVFGATTQARDIYINVYGIKLFWDQTEITLPVMLAFMAGVAVLFLLLAALKLRLFKQK